MIIAIDFDGTCVKHKFPKVGEDIGAVPILKKLVDAGHQLILFTMRADREYKRDTGDPNIQDVTGTFLADAVNWFKKNNIPLWGIQTNPDQHKWTTSPKAYAQLYIDDAGLGCPLTTDGEGNIFADWDGIEQLLFHKGIL